MEAFVLPYAVERGTFGHGACELDMAAMSASVVVMSINILGRSTESSG